MPDVNRKKITDRDIQRALYRYVKKHKPSVVGFKKWYELVNKDKEFAQSIIDGTIESQTNKGRIK